MIRVNIILKTGLEQKMKTKIKTQKIKKVNLHPTKNNTKPSTNKTNLAYNKRSRNNNNKI